MISSEINVVEVDLIYNKMRFILSVSRTGPNTFYLVMNNSHKILDGYYLADGGILLCVDQKSYTTYMNEEAMQYHIEVDRKTWVFEKQSDPSELRSPTTGKLVNLLVENGSHLKQNQEYGEIEVMKMIMTLRASEAGTVYFIKKPGCTLESGAIIGHLELDDSTLVSAAQPYTLPFPVEAKEEIVVNLIERHNK